MNKSLTALNKMIEKYDWVGKEYCRLIGKNESLHKVNQEAFENLADTIKQDLERLEKINEVWHDNEPMESVDINDEHLQELYDYINKLEKENEQLKQQRDSLAINNGELCVKVCKLEKENQELKELVDSLNKEQILGVERIFDLEIENQKLKKAIEILKDYPMSIIDVIRFKDYFQYREYYDGVVELSKGDFDLLKEVLE